MYFASPWCICKINRPFHKAQSFFTKLKFFFYFYLNFTICPVEHLVKYYNLENKNIACGWLPSAVFYLPGCLLYFYCDVCETLFFSLLSILDLFVSETSWFGCVISLSLYFLHIWRFPL